MVKIGLHFVNFDVPGGAEALPATLASAAKAAEPAGADSQRCADGTGTRRRDGGR
jgi:hypothetical protein